MNDMHKSLVSCGFEPMDSTTEPPPNYYSAMHSTIPTTTTSASLLMPPDSGIQSTIASNFPSTLPSSSSTTISEYPPQQLPPPNALPADFIPSQKIEELEQLIANENDKKLLLNSLMLLFSWSIDNIHGPEVCRLASASQIILNTIYKLLTDDEFKDDDSILFFPTHNLMNLSKYEAGRSAILGCNGLQAEWPSRGVRSLINSLQSRDSNIVILAITAVHNLLLDRRMEVQDIAKKQVKHTDGIKHIVNQLRANRDLENNYEFKVVVLDCLQILAYGNPENRLTILESKGPRLLLATIEENLVNQPTEELVETASRVLKSLSVCPSNKVDIIMNNGIKILTRCIKLDNQEILKTCLWTLRNLSDVINKYTDPKHESVEQLIERLLEILYHYSEEPCIVTCALGVLANLTCKNEPVKQFICKNNGVELLLAAIDTALRDSRDFRIGNNEILEPAVCTLCHLMNQPSYAELEVERQRVQHYTHSPAFEVLRREPQTEELAKAVEKLISLIGDYKVAWFLCNQSGL